MAIHTFEVQKNYIGLSTDTKTPGRPGEKFFESNTGKAFIWDGERWVEDLSLIYALNVAMKD